VNTKNTRFISGDRPVARRSVNLPIKTASLSAAPQRVIPTGAPAARVANEMEALRTETLDAFTLYMREVGQTKLLTREEEILLARRIKKGDKRAREQMIKANLRLVVKIAYGYENSGLPLLDLVSEGNIGLMTGVQRFDPKKGAKFSTYVAFWIKQSIRRALANQSRTIRLPVHVVDKLFHMRQIEMCFREVTGRDPNDQELSLEIGLSAKQIAAYRSASVSPTSLDALLGDSNDSSSFSEIVPDEKIQTPYRQLEKKSDASLVREIVETLDKREHAILRSRFGLDGDGKETLEELGKKFGVTRERIRQIQEAALIKLRCKIEKLETAQEIAA
jgi:RNA polymerase primary sigma factor